MEGTVKKNILWLVLAVLTFWVLGQGGFKKYIFVLFIAFCALALKHFRIQRNYFVVLAPSICYSLLGFLNALVNRNITKDTFKEICFLLIPALAAICIFNAVHYERINIVIDIQFWAIVIIWIVMTSGGNIIEQLNNPNLLESQYAFILGAYAVYYYARRKKVTFCFSVLFAYLAHKRIAFAAVIACIALITVLNMVKKQQIKRWLLNCIVAGTIAASYIWILWGKQEILNKIFSKLGIITMGRIEVWREFSVFYEVNPLYWGQGLGFVVDKLKQLEFVNFARVHNDLLQMYIEVGFWGFGLSIIAYFYLALEVKEKTREGMSKRILLVSLVIYTIINYLTDNIMVYINYWLPMYILFLGIMFAPLEYKKMKTASGD